MWMTLIKKKMKKFQINKDWTLFLDRDGVINERIVNGYVMDSKNLILTPNLIKALKILSVKFGRMLVVSNQQCVGKGYCSHQTIDQVHSDLNDILIKEKILISDFFFCPHKASDNCTCRKPKSGLALKAQQKYPTIDFSKSVMVGDMITDIFFGKNLGMTTVYVGEIEIPHFSEIKENADFIFDNLYEFAKKIV